MTRPAQPNRLTAGQDAEARRARNAVMAVIVVAAALAAGVALAVVPRTSAGLWFAAAPVFIAVLFVLLQGPKWCLAAIIASVVFGLSNYSATAGGIDVRVTDLFYVALGVWVLVLRARDGQRGYLVGRRMLAVWLVIIGFSLYPLLVQGVAQQASVVAWLRFVATFSLVWFVPYALRTVKDVEFTLGVLALAATAEVGGAALINLAAGHVAERLRGANGPNSTGMLAVLVLVLALHGPVPRRRSLRYTMVIVGAVGLLMTRSLAATTAAVVVLGFYGLWGVYKKRDTSRAALLTPSRVLFMLVVGLLVATVLRPSNLPGSSGFGNSTTANRLVLADAGLRLFAERPVTGVGWQRTPFAIGAPAVNAALHEDWGTDVNPNFFPSGPHGASAHNAYVQILAESGAVGFIGFVLALILITAGIVRVLRAVRPQPVLYLCMRVTLVLIVVIMVWLNDNPLYGAQPETVLLAMFLGMFAAAPAILRTTPERAPL